MATRYQGAGRIGIYLGWSCNNIIEYCSINNHTTNLSIGVMIAWESNNTRIQNCYFNDNTGANALQIHAYCKNTLVKNIDVSRNNVGISITSLCEETIIRDCNIYDNVLYGMNAETNGKSVDAVENWWGDSSGPYHEVRNTNGRGDKVSDNVEFDPWLGEPSTIETYKSSSDSDEDGRIDPIIPMSIAVSIVGVGIVGLIFGKRGALIPLYALITLPLYSRIEREDILGQARRNDIYSYICANPGTNYSKLKNQLCIGNGSLLHHLNVLQREGYIQSKKEMGQRLYFSKISSGPLGINGPIHPPSPIQELILIHLRNAGPQTRKQIKLALSLKHQTVSYSLRNLERKRLIRVLEHQKLDLYEIIEW